MNQLRAALQAALDRPGAVTRAELRALMFENPEPETGPLSEAITAAIHNPIMGLLKNPPHVKVNRGDTVEEIGARAVETNLAAVRYIARGAVAATVAAGYRRPLPGTPIYPNAVQAFIDERPRYVDAARNTRGSDNMADYHRWQGHMEARRQLCEALGLTVPFEPGDTARPVPAVPELENIRKAAYVINMPPPISVIDALNRNAT